LVAWTSGSLPWRGAGRIRRLRVAVCALSDIAWRDHPDLRAEESFRRLLQFPFIGSITLSGFSSPTAIHARYRLAGPTRSG